MEDTSDNLQLLLFLTVNSVPLSFQPIDFRSRFSSSSMDSLSMYLSFVLHLVDVC